ncbi:MAG: hypothetical protein R3C69_16105 [Geminicoccaceae bacterium]
MAVDVDHARLDIAERPPSGDGHGHGTLGGIGEAVAQNLDPAPPEGLVQGQADAALEAVREGRQAARRVGFPDEFRPGMRHFLQQLLGARGNARHPAGPAPEEADGEKAGEAADGDGDEQHREGRLADRVAAGPAGGEAGPEAGAEDTAGHHAERQPGKADGPGLWHRRG